MFLVMLNALRLAPPVVEMALERLVEDPGRSEVDLRHLEAACSVFREDADALVAMLVARHSDEHMVSQAEELFCYFRQVEAQIGALIEPAQD